MAKTYSDLLQEVQAAVRQVSLEELHRRMEAGEDMVIVDVREKDEWRQGLHSWSHSSGPRISGDECGS